MTCSHCCGAAKIFDDKEASKKLRSYRKKGPVNTTRRLLKAIGQENIDGKTLLDIGGGVGAIQQELLAKGVRYTTDVDASASYIRAAGELCTENNMDGRMHFVQGDFLDVHQQVEQHDLVTLEKVVCCYPYVEDLIKTSTGKSRELYGLVYPMDNLISKFLNMFGNFYLYLTRNPFRSFIHSEDLINEMVTGNGFKRIHYSTVFPWKVAVYRRTRFHFPS